MILAAIFCMDGGRQWYSESKDEAVAAVSARSKGVLNKRFGCKNGKKRMYLGDTEEEEQIWAGCVGQERGRSTTF